MGIRHPCFWEDGSGFRLRKGVAAEGNPSTIVHCGVLSEHLACKSPPLYTFVMNSVGVAVCFSYLVAVNFSYLKS